MKTLKNLSYRVKRFFQGESGIVERVEEVPYKDRFCEFFDYDGKCHTLITFRNPLEELITEPARKTLERRAINHGDLERLSLNPGKKYLNVYIYKTYKPGDKFP